MSATRRSASFQAATISSVVPRTPRSHSCAIAALCRTSPMTRIAIAIPVTRRALIDDRHQRHAESDYADAPREEGLEAPPRQEVDIGRKPLSGLPIDRMGKSLRKPVDNGKSRVH